ncbi:MAG TPA: trypsin-like peptidase domain-containing protein, partial [Planctomycetota bacterium]|nr:trypsin-like peptidase domain-containing protein [Planctomycetota bacterium]
SRAVVAIKVERDAEPARPSAETPKRSPFRGMPFGHLQDVFAQRPADAWCSGVVAEADGVILTTHFNVAGKVRAVKVLLPDGRELEGRVLGFNGTYDLAAIKVEAKGLPTLARAPVETLKAGQPLLALGRAPDGKGLTANPGIVSAASRLGGRGIQLDAKLNYGNVGGPVVDLDGRLIGVSCKVDTKFSSTRGQNSGVGYAITHDRLPEILKELKEGRSVAESRRPLLGIVFNQKSSKKGVELESVQPGGAAEKAGIKAGDVIVEFDGTAISYFDELRASIMRRAPGDRVKVKVLRGEETLEFDCELGWDDRGE